MSLAQHYRAKVGGLVRRGASPERIEQARRELSYAVSEARVKAIVDAATLTADQRAQLAAILNGGAGR